MSTPTPTASSRSRNILAFGVLAILVCILMGYFICESYHAPAIGNVSADDVAQARRALEHGSAAQRREALLQLIAAKAETELAQCLASGDPTVVQLAVAGLWECWLNEAGAEPREIMEEGIAAMNDGDLSRAAMIFGALMTKYPAWAEAINKQATVLYLQGQPEESIALCKKVVALKPDHFGAWNGMALCALQTEDWPLALHAVRESLRLQPKSPANLQLLKLVESRLPQV